MDRFEGEVKFQKGMTLEQYLLNVHTLDSNLYE